jgi:hypothetical protein
MGSRNCILSSGEITYKTKRRSGPRQPEDESTNKDVDDEAVEGDKENIGPVSSLAWHSGHRTPWIHQEDVRVYSFCQMYLDSFRRKQASPAVVVTWHWRVSYFVFSLLLKSTVHSKRESFWVRYALHYASQKRRSSCGTVPQMLVNEEVHQAPPDFDPTTHKTLV